MENLVDITARGRSALAALVENSFTWLATSGLQIFLIVIAAWALLALSKRMLNRFHRTIAGKKGDPERAKRADTLTGILGTVIWMLLFLAAGMMVLREIGVEIAPIIAVAGLGGLAIGFGAQNLVRDVITGFFLLAEDQLRVGDFVEVAGKAGEVTALGLRTVRLRDLEGTLHIVPNGNIDIVSNMTKDYAYALISIGVAYRENTDEVMRLIEDVCSELQSDATYGPQISEPIEMHGVTEFADSAVMIRFRLKTAPAWQWAVSREFNRRIKIRFDEQNVEIPFPHVTFYAGEDKNGKAPALPLAAEYDKAA